MSNVIYIKPKKLQNESITTLNIDWSHRFEVRGHWRVFEGVGKNRDGEYNIEGFTWVKNYVKGPEHLPLVKKTRVVEQNP